MKIGIIGSGNMGRTLGTRWAELGHQIYFGAKTADAGNAVADFAAHDAQGGDAKNAVEFGDVLLYCLRETVSETGLPKQSFAGKTVIDINNGEIPADFDYPPITQSKAEKLAEDIPEAFVVKAFNTMAQEVYENSPETFRQHEVASFICGDDQSAKKAVMTLAEELGLKPVDCGDLRRAQLLENLGDFVRFRMGGADLGAMHDESMRIFRRLSDENLQKKCLNPEHAPITI